MTDLSKLNDIWAIFERTKVMHCITRDGEKFYARPMSGVMLEGEYILGATFRNSKKVAQAGATGNAGFYFYDTEKMHYACLSGAAEITDTKEMRDKLWKDEFSEHFPGGVDDENYVVMKMKIENIDYVSQM